MASLQWTLNPLGYAPPRYLTMNFGFVWDPNTKNSLPNYKRIQMTNVMGPCLSQLSLFMRSKLLEINILNVAPYSFALTCESYVKAFLILQLNHSPQYLKHTKIFWISGITPLPLRGNSSNQLTKRKTMACFLLYKVNNEGNKLQSFKKIVWIHVSIYRYWRK